MSLALEQGILKCISTDTVRAVMRSYVPGSISPPLHRSSYGEFYKTLCLFMIDEEVKPFEDNRSKITSRSSQI